MHKSHASSCILAQYSPKQTMLGLKNKILTSKPVVRPLYYDLCYSNTNVRKKILEDQLEQFANNTYDRHARIRQSTEFRPQPLSIQNTYLLHSILLLTENCN